MNSDIRLQMSFYNNTKVKRLQRVLGSDAVVSLIYLWLYTAENRPHGELRGMDEIDIAVAAQWGGDPSSFVTTLCDLKFLDKKKTLFSVHDWKINNPWACDAPARSEKAKKAAEAKWLKKNSKKVCYEQDLALLNDAQGYAPSPSPSPSPKEEEKLAACFDDHSAFLKNKFPSADMEMQKAMLLAKYGKKPVIDPWVLILSWFEKLPLSAQAKPYTGRSTEVCL